MSDPNLFAFLTNVPSVAAIAGDRIYKQQIPQHDREDASRYPCAVFLRSGGDRTATFCGSDGIVPGTFRILCISQDPDEPEILANAIRRALADYRGLMGDVPVCKVDIVNDTDEGPEPVPGLYIRTVTANLWYWED